MKLNLGCGFRRREGWHNVDKLAAYEPDQIFDLTQTPWPFADSSVDEFAFDHSLEEMGSSPDDLIRVLKEVYRVGRDGAQVQILCLHPRHDRFVYNPLCTQRLSPNFFRFFSKSENNQQIQAGVLDFSFGLIHNVDFDFIRGTALFSSDLKAVVESGEETVESLLARAARENNICEAFEIELRIRKPETKA